MKKIAFVILGIMFFIIAIFFAWRYMSKMQNCKKSNNQYIATMEKGLNYNIQKGYVKEENRGAEKIKNDQYAKDDFESCMKGYSQYEPTK